MSTFHNEIAEFPFQRIDDPNILKSFRQVGETSSSQDAEAVMKTVDHILALITVCYQLARDCGENQRLLVESMPGLFSTLLVDCLQLSPFKTQSLKFSSE